MEAHNSNSNNPENLFRDLKIRHTLDRVEAESELAKKSDLAGFSIVFTESARSSLEKMILKFTDPERYRLLLQSIEARWLDSWSVLERLNPADITFSTSRHPCCSDFYSYLLWRDRGRVHSISESAPGLSVLIKLPTENTDFFRACIITTPKSIFSWIKNLSDKSTNTLGFDLEKTALEVAKDNRVKSCGKYLVIPENFDLSNKEEFIKIMKEFLQDKMSSTFIENCNFKLFDARKEYQERLSKQNILTAFAHRVLDFAFFSLVKFIGITQKNKPDKLRVPRDSILADFPIYKYESQDWCNNSDDLSRFRPADISIKDYIDN